MGNDFSKGVDSAVAIVTGIITGDITGGLAGASAPWIAEQIKLHTGHSENGEWKTDSPVANLVAHTILGAVVAELQGHSGVVGGASAVSGEIAAPIIQKALYGDRDVKDLTEEEKENISALTQLAVGLTIASMGGDESDIATGVNSSKNAVENNNLKLVLQLVFGGKPITVSMSEYLMMQGFTAAQAELLINSMTETQKALFEYRMGLGAEYALQEQIKELKKANMDALDPDKLPKLEGYPYPEKPSEPLPGYKPLDPEELGPNHTGGDQILGPSEPLPGYEPLDPAWTNNVLTSEISDGKDREQNLPEWVSDINPPNSRHYFNNINQKTTAKPMNTVIDSSVDVAADMKAIKNGQASIKGNQITVNGRIYEREANGTLAPISGNGFTTLNRGEFKSLGVYNQFGNTKRAEDILNSMGMSAEARANALEVWRKNKK